MMFNNQTWLCALLLLVAMASADQTLRKRDVFQIEEVENKDTADFFNAEQRVLSSKKSGKGSGKGGSETATKKSVKKSGKGGGKGDKDGSYDSGKGGSATKKSGTASGKGDSGKGGSGTKKSGYASGKGDMATKKSAKKSGKGGGKGDKDGSTDDDVPYESKGSKKDRVMDDFEDMVFGSMSMSMNSVVFPFLKPSLHRSEFSKGITQINSVAKSSVRGLHATCCLPASSSSWR
eukprot:scaffold23807_cov113-Cylindrotheca_fusiformis.AAC.2